MPIINPIEIAIEPEESPIIIPPLLIINNGNALSIRMYEVNLKDTPCKSNINKIIDK